MASEPISEAIASERANAWRLVPMAQPCPLAAAMTGPFWKTDPVAMAAIVLVALMGWYLSFSRAERINNPAVLLEARAGGIEWKQGQTTMTMMQRGDEKASFTTVDMKGSASSRYVDAETGQVAITNVYVD